jgi:hypothetical protein
MLRRPPFVRGVASREVGGVRFSIAITAAGACARSVSVACSAVGSTLPAERVRGLLEPIEAGRLVVSAPSANTPSRTRYARIAPSRPRTPLLSVGCCCARRYSRVSSVQMPWARMLPAIQHAATAVPAALPNKRGFVQIVARCCSRIRRPTARRSTIALLSNLLHTGSRIASSDEVRSDRFARSRGLLCRPQEPVKLRDELVPRGLVREKYVVWRIKEHEAGIRDQSR